MYLKNSSVDFIVAVNCTAFLARYPDRAKRSGVQLWIVKMKFFLTY